MLVFIKFVGLVLPKFVLSHFLFENHLIPRLEKYSNLSDNHASLEIICFVSQYMYQICINQLLPLSYTFHDFCRPISNC